MKRTVCLLTATLLIPGMTGCGIGRSGARETTPEITPVTTPGITDGVRYTFFYISGNEDQQCIYLTGSSDGDALNIADICASYFPVQ